MCVLSTKVSYNCLQFFAGGVDRCLCGFFPDSYMNLTSAILPPFPAQKKPRTQIRICLSLLLLLSGASLSRKGRRGRRRVRHIRFPPRTKFEIKKEEGGKGRDIVAPQVGKGGMWGPVIFFFFFQEWISYSLIFLGVCPREKLFTPFAKLPKISQTDSQEKEIKISPKDPSIFPNFPAIRPTFSFPSEKRVQQVLSK